MSNIEQIFYFDKEDNGELIQVEIIKNIEHGKFYMSVYDGKKFTNIEVNEDEMEIMFDGLGEALNK